MPALYWMSDQVNFAEGRRDYGVTCFIDDSQELLGNQKNFLRSCFIHTVALARLQ